MRRQRKGLPAGLLLLFVVAAAVINLLLGIAAQRLLELSKGSGADTGAKNVMEISLVPSSPKERSEEEQEKQKKQLIDKELVQNHEIVREEAPDDAKRVSEFDNDVDRETRAPRQRPRQAVRPSQPSASRNQQKNADKSARPNQPQPRSSEQNDAKQQKTQAPSESQGPTVDPSKVAQSAREMDDGQLAPGQGARTGLLTPRAGAMQAQRGTSLLQPKSRPSAAPAPTLAGSPSQLRQVLGAYGSLDRAKDVDDGEKNIFKTRRYRFASFFNRVRIAIAQEWHPEVVHAARDPYGNIYGSKDRTTRLKIRLAKDGSLVQAALDYSCAVSYLDEEAIRAVRTAQPFTHPPPELIDPETGYIEFLFAFTLEISGRRRIFRTSRK